jgi:LPS-assembly protein
MLSLPLAMRARTFLFTTLLLLCHPQLWSQALTKQFPPAEESGSFPDDPSLQSAIPEAHVVPPPPVGVPVKIGADTQTYVKTDTGGLYTLSGHAVIHYKDYVVSADHVTYNQDTGDVVAEGHLHLDGGPDDAHFVADHGTMNLDRHTGHFYDVTGTLGVEQTPGKKMVFTSGNPFALTGREMIQTGPQDYQVIDGTITSCRLPKPDWQLIAHDFFLEDGKARAKNSVFELLRMPVFFLPYVTHPVNDGARDSGFLIPIIGNDTSKGLILGEEVYYVMGRSADLIVGSEYFSKRGFAPLGQFRYKGRGYDFATVRFHSLLDRLTGTQNQGGVDLIADGRYDFDSETRAVSDAEYLSSYAYRQAFEENYAVVTNSEVKSTVFLSHSHQGLFEGVGFNRYQSFESNQSSTSGQEEIRILHIPTLQFEGLDQSLGDSPLMWGADVTGSGLSRTEPGFETSRIVPRFDFYPHLALPVHFGGWTLRPVVAVRDTFYGKSQNPGPIGMVPTERDATLNRKDFEASVDLRPPALMRDFSAPWLVHLLGAEVRHTIEPEVQYLYVVGIDNFNSVLKFDGVDVASNTNELDYFLTQRLFLRHVQPHPCNGDEALGPDEVCGGESVDWLTWRVGQKYFFNPNFGNAITTGTRNVLDTTLDLSGVAFLTAPRYYSPVISRLQFHTSAATDVEWDLDYDTKAGKLDSSNVFASYRHGDYSFNMGFAHLDTLTGAPPAGGTTSSTEDVTGSDRGSGTVSENRKTAPAATSGTSTTTSTTSPITVYNQLRVTATYGSPIKRGLSAGVSTGYDFELHNFQYIGGQTGYNWNCCGLSFEVRKYSLGSVRNDTQYLYSFTLAGVGSAGSLKRAERVY